MNKKPEQKATEKMKEDSLLMPNYFGVSLLNLSWFNDTHKDDLEIWIRQFETGHDTTNSNPQLQSTFVKIGQNYHDENALEWLFTTDTVFTNWKQFNDALKSTFHHCQGTTRYLTILRDRKETANYKFYDYSIYMTKIARRAKCDARHTFDPNLIHIIMP